MKYISIVLICGLLVSCVSAVSDIESKNRKTVENSEQHLRVGYSMAEYYCEFGAWPKTLEELKKFSMNDVTHHALPINWVLFEQFNVDFEVSETVTIKTYSEIGNESVMSSSIISKHDRPSCYESGYGSKITVSPSV